MFLAKLLKLRLSIIFALLLIRSVSSITYDCKDGNDTSEDEWKAKIKMGIHPRELDGICIPPDYDKFSKGNLTDYKTTPPKINVTLTSLDFDEDRMEGKVSMWVVYEWTDARLRVVDLKKIKNMVPSTLRHVWNPDLYISYIREGEDEKTTYPLPKPTPDRSLEAYRDSRANGSDFVRFSALLNYWYMIPSDTGAGYTFYPYDKHELRFSLGFRGLDWVNGAHEEHYVLSNKVRQASFHIAISSRKNENQDIINSGAVFEYVIVLVRKVQSQLIRIYIPSGLFVILCGLSMLLPVELVAERVALCTGTLLTITTFFNTTSQLGPSVDYLRALDIWLLGCIFFIFVTVFENIAVMKMTGRFNKIQLTTSANDDDKIGKTLEKISQMQLGILGVDESGRETVDRVNSQSIDLARADDLEAGLNQINDSKRKVLAARRVDRASIFVVTVGILIFNVVYWTWLLALNHND